MNTQSPEAVKELQQLGYTVEEWSKWEGDKGKYRFCRGAGLWLGLLNTNTRTISPCHGFYGGLLKPLAKTLNYKLNPHG